MHVHLEELTRETALFADLLGWAGEPEWEAWRVDSALDTLERSGRSEEFEEKNWKPAVCGAEACRSAALEHERVRVEAMEAVLTKTCTDAYRLDYITRVLSGTYHSGFLARLLPPSLRAEKEEAFSVMAAQLLEEPRPFLVAGRPVPTHQSGVARWAFGHRRTDLVVVPSTLDGRFEKDFDLGSRTDLPRWQLAVLPSGRDERLLDVVDALFDRSGSSLTLQETVDAAAAVDAGQ